MPLFDPPLKASRNAPNENRSPSIKMVVDFSVTHFFCVIAKDSRFSTVLVLETGLTSLPAFIKVDQLKLMLGYFVQVSFALGMECILYFQHALNGVEASHQCRYHLKDLLLHHQLQDQLQNEPGIPM